MHAYKPVNGQCPTFCELVKCLDIEPFLVRI